MTVRGLRPIPTPDQPVMVAVDIYFGPDSEFMGTAWVSQEDFDQAEAEDA